MIDPDMDISSWPLNSDPFVFDGLTEFIGDANFCRTILFVPASTTAVVTICCEPVDEHCHRVELRCQSISMPWHSSLPLFVPLFAMASSTFLLELKHYLPQKVVPSQILLCKCNQILVKAAWVDEILELWIVTFI